MARARDAARQKPPPDDLDDFPAVTIRTNRRLFRCHRTANGCWYFGSAPAVGVGGRWDLPAPAGTCYVAESPEGALMETLGTDLSDHGFVTESFIRDRQITRVRLPRAARAADLTAKDVSQHGVTSELTGAVPYVLTQQWARAFHDTGFSAVRYGLRFRPNTAGLGLFGPAGPADHPVVTSTPARTVALALGIPLEPIPRLSELDVVEPD